jgi:hypothetical protein
MNPFSHKKPLRAGSSVLYVSINSGMAPSLILKSQSPGRKSLPQMMKCYDRAQQQTDERADSNEIVNQATRLVQMCFLGLAARQH